MKKIITLILSAIMVLSVFSVIAVAEGTTENSGICGENVTWKFDESTGTLTISGTGEMNTHLEECTSWSAFETQITRVVFEEGVTSVFDLAFLNEDGNLSNLKEVEFSNTITYIGDNAFAMCDGLTSVIIPDSVTEIGTNAFMNCDGLEKVVIGNGTKNIRMAAFNSCENLKTVIFGENLEQIGGYAFTNCHNLTNVYIPSKVSSIGGNAFAGCSNIGSFLVDESNQYYSNDESGALLNKDQTYLHYYPLGNADAFYQVPQSVETIGYYCFAESKLKQINCSKSLAEISSGVFADCTELNSIFIYDDVTTIGDYAFQGCISLGDVYYSGTEDDWNLIEIFSENDCLLNAIIHFEQVEYNIIDKVESSDSYTVRADGEFSKFTGVKVDGELVDSSNYTATEGSTIIEFKADYLETLEAGEHTVSVVFTDGIAITNFEIEEDNTDDTTNDNTNNNTNNDTNKNENENNDNLVTDVEIPNTDYDRTIVSAFVTMTLSGVALVGLKKKK